MPSYQEARAIVIEKCRSLGHAPTTEILGLTDAFGRVSAQEIRADRDYPPFDRAARDGFAVRSADCENPGASLRIIAEVAAGAGFTGRVGAGECVQIMTGAPVPEGADAVVMIEQTHAGEQENAVVIERGATLGMNFVPYGSESRKGDLLLRAAARMGAAEASVAAQVGCTHLTVYRKPRVAILSTGNEVVDVGAQPGAHEIRNSNSFSLTAQTEFAGGEAVPLGNALDRREEIRASILRGLEEDALIVSGGVSAGKYDLVEPVLRELGAELFFDSVEIRPGRPAVFAICKKRPVFGLPGNPVSTMVTFELLVTPALDILGGAEPRPLRLLKAKLKDAVEQRGALTYFLPARIEWNSGEASVSLLQWQGSGDMATVARANCFLVVPQNKLKLSAGEFVDVLPRREIM